MGVDLVPNLATITNNLPNNVALERIRLSDGMISPSLRFVFESASVQTLADIEWASVGSAEDIYIVSSCDRLQICIDDGSVTLTQHRSRLDV